MDSEVVQRCATKSAVTVTDMAHGCFITSSYGVDDRSDQSAPHSQPMSYKGLSSDANDA